MSESVGAFRAEEAYTLSPQQVAYFNAFGFVKLPGLVKDDIADLTAGFEAVFAEEHADLIETRHERHLDRKRVMMPLVIERDERLANLRDDPRVLGVITSLIGDDYEYAGSDGSLFWCESSWHSDIYGAPLSVYHVKLSFYLDPLTAESGAIRMIPGTHHVRETFSKTLRRNLDAPAKIQDIYGIDGSEVPSWPVASEPGDVIVWNYRTMHASYNGGERRRLFSISFRERAQPGSNGPGPEGPERERRPAE